MGRTAPTWRSGLGAGADFANERFGYDDEFDPLDHFHAEAYERYIELASQPDPPIPEDVGLAVRMGTAWLGDKLDERGRLAFSTAVVRAYLWRKVENGPVDFLEPHLTEAVQRSFTVGDDRRDDEGAGVTYFYAASQCMVENVKTRLGFPSSLVSLSPTSSACAKNRLVVPREWGQADMRSDPAGDEFVRFPLPDC